jgi:hypothetical protein
MHRRTGYRRLVLRPWADIDWQAPRPEWQDIKRSHEQLSFRAYDVEDLAVTAMLDELRRTHHNGGALLTAFALEHDDETLHWFASRNRFVEYQFFQAFLGSVAVRDALPELHVPEQLARDLGFEQSWSGTLTLDGELAATIVLGGAYKRFKGTPTQAKELGAAFVDALVGERHAEFKVYRSFKPWSRWFLEIAWDSTVLIIDQAKNEVVLLCWTDTD